MRMTVKKAVSDELMSTWPQPVAILPERKDRIQQSKPKMLLSKVRRRSSSSHPGGE